jgi:hypothetical protein
MKKLFLFVLFASFFSVPLLSAQGKVVISVDAEALTTVGTMNPKVVGASLLEDGAWMEGINLGASFLVTRHMSFGIGAGYRFYEGKLHLAPEGLGTGEIPKSLFQFFREQSLPLFVKADVFGSKDHRFSPYLEGKAGYNFLTKTYADDWADWYLRFKGFFAATSAGVQLNLASMGIRAGFVVMIDTLNNSSITQNTLVPYCGLQVGMVF